MFTTHKVQVVTVLTLALAVLIVVAATAFGRVSFETDRATDAYSLRLTLQAEQIQKEAARAAAARAAWSARLDAQFQAMREEAARAERASKAWSDRLTGQAEQHFAQLSDQANGARNERFNRLIGAYAASE